MNGQKLLFSLLLLVLLLFGVALCMYDRITPFTSERANCHRPLLEVYDIPGVCNPSFSPARSKSPFFAIGVNSHLASSGRASR